MKAVTVTLSIEDAEPILRKAAEDAAKFGGWLDHITRRTWQSPSATGENHDAARKRWKASYTAARRVVMAFGINPEETSEEEAITVTYRSIGGTTTRKAIAGMPFIVRDGTHLDYDHPEPCYQSEVHAEACRQAAKRTVRLWREQQVCGC